MPVTDEQSQTIISLAKQGTKARSVSKSLRKRVSPGTVAAVRAWMPRDEETEVVKAVDAAFGLERDLQRALREQDNIKQLDPSLRIIDGNQERKVASGFIDITAEDNHGTT